MSESRSNRLPDSWELATIGAVSVVNPPSTTVAPPDKQLVTFLPMAAVEELSGRIDLGTQRTFGEVKKGFTRFRNGDVLFAKITPSMENGKVAVAADLAGGLGCGTTEFHVIRPRPGVSADYIRYFMVRSAYRQEAKRNMQGAVGQQRVPADYVRDSPLPIAPSTEQQRIVSKIDELFSRIDEGERALERVSTLVERYRQSVLKAAVTGELTRDWRERRKATGQPVESGEALLTRILTARREAWEQAELAKMQAKGVTPKDDAWLKKYKEPSPPDTTGLPELPLGWVWGSVDQVGFVTGGLTKNQKRVGHGTQRPYLRVANVYVNRLDLCDVHEIGVSESELERVLLENDDLLVVEGNGSIEQIGRVALWDGSIPGCVHQNHLIKVRCSAGLPSWYVLVWCMSPLGREHIRRVASSTAGLHTLSISKIQALPIPVPASAELELIHDRFEQMDSIVVNQQASMEAESARSTALRQTILKAAFSGGLIAQDVGDEPATVLLERIAAERVDPATTAPKRGRKTRFV